MMKGRMAEELHLSKTRLKQHKTQRRLQGTEGELSSGDRNRERL